MRLDPFYVPLASLVLASAHYMLKQYSEALSLLRGYVVQVPTHQLGHLLLAATYAQLSQLDAAQSEAAEVLRLTPKFTIPRVPASLFKYSTDFQHYFDGIRKAGLPES
jgi:tetratricopeptide (TPR) repeat protein